MANKTGKTLKDIDYKQMARDYKKPVLITVGIAAGAVGVKQLIKALNKSKQVSGLLGVDMDKVKKYIIPAGTAAAGLAATQLIQGQAGKLIATGVAINGTILLANQVLNTNVLAGIGDPGIGDTGPIAESPATARQLPGEQIVKLDLPLYELEEPVVNTTSYIDNVMADVRPITRKPVLIQKEPEEEIEVNLESNRPEDNFEVKKQFEPESHEDVSGTLEAIILPPEPQVYPQQEFKEELDFSNIP